MLKVDTAFQEYMVMWAVRKLLETNRSSRNKILKLNVDKYPGGPRQLASDLFHIYPG
jgi:hypothetical protein